MGHITIDWRVGISLFCRQINCTTMPKQCMNVVPHFGLIDGTVRKIARPKYLQRIMYNGHKRVHAIKFQSIVLPNGLISNLSGPYEGKRHDCTMLEESRVLPNLRQVAFHNGVPLCLYGDPAYPLGVHLQGPFRELPLTPKMQAYNKAMSKLRVSVEWMFGN